MPKRKSTKVGKSPSSAIKRPKTAPFKEIKYTEKSPRKTKLPGVTQKSPSMNKVSANMYNLEDVYHFFFFL